jgi:hypothetical protein
MLRNSGERKGNNRDSNGSSNRARAGISAGNDRHIRPARLFDCHADSRAQAGPEDRHDIRAYCFLARKIFADAPPVLRDAQRLVQNDAIRAVLRYHNLEQVG